MSKKKICLISLLLLVAVQCTRTDESATGFNRRILYYTHSADYTNYKVDFIEQVPLAGFNVATNQITVSGSGGLKSVTEYNNFIYIVDSSATGKLLVYNRETLALVKSLDLGGQYPQEMVITSGKAYIGITGPFGTPDNKVKVVNLDNPGDPFVATTLTAGKNPTVLRYLNGKIYVSNIDNVDKTQSSVNPIDVGTNTVESAINTGENPVDLAWDNTKLWTYNAKWYGGSAASLNYISGTTPTLVSTFPAGYAPAYGGKIAFAAGQGYVLLSNGSTLSDFSNLLHLFTITGTSVNTTAADSVNQYRYLGTGSSHLFKVHNGNGSNNQLTVEIESLTGGASGTVTLTKESDIDFWPAR